MVSVVRFLFAPSTVFGVTLAFALVGRSDTPAHAGSNNGIKSEHARELATDLSDRRRRRGRGYRSSSRDDAAPTEQSQPSAENRCDARDMVQVDWDFIERVVIPVGDQRQHLTDLKAAVAEADTKILASCAIEARLTPTGRLEAMEKRLEIRLEALKSLRTPLEAFYSALDDEQKARFISSTAQTSSARTFSDPGGQSSEAGEERRSRRSRRR